MRIASRSSTPASPRRPFPAATRLSTASLTTKAACTRPRIRSAGYPNDRRRASRACSGVAVSEEFDHGWVAEATRQHRCRCRAAVRHLARDFVVRVLVVGHERSATTWVGEVLGSTARSGFVNEPDDPRESAFAVRAMAGLGTLPVLTASDTASRSLIRLWDVAFGVHRPRYVRGQRRVSTRLLRSASTDELDRMQGQDRRLTVQLRMAAALGVPRHVGSAVPREHHVAKSVHAPLM